MNEWDGDYDEAAEAEAMRECARVLREGDAEAAERARLWAQDLFQRVDAVYPCWRSQAFAEVRAIVASTHVPDDDPERLEAEVWAALEFTIDLGNTFLK